MTKLPLGLPLLGAFLFSGSLLGFSSEALADNWLPAASMTTPRFYHTATTIQNGKVLIAGGTNRSSALSSAELYDPLTDTWSSAGHMAAARYGHNASLLADGKVLVTGGWAGGTISGAELFDPATNTWSPAAPLITGRHGHGQVLLPNGRVLVAGGYSTYFGMLARAELYDPSSNTWTSAPSMSEARHAIWLNAVVLPSGSALVAGGIDASSKSLATAEVYDPYTNSWHSAGPMSEPHGSGLTATLLQDGRVLVAGGGTTSYSVASADLYDPTTNTFSPAAPMSVPRFEATAALMPNGMVLVAGGYDLRLNICFGSAELYDPLANAWNSAGSMATPRYASKAAALLDGRAIQVGGIHCAGSWPVLASAELFESNRPPQAVCRQDLMLRAGETCTASADIDSGSFDPDGDAITRDQSPASPYPLGETPVTLTVQDVYGLSDSCATTVHVDDFSSPIPDPELPTVSGQCSAEINSVPTATDNCDGVVAGATSDPLSYNEPGSYTVTWVYVDVSGNGDSQTQSVVVADTIAPTIDALAASPAQLWPPNHAMVPVSVFSTATDNCTSDPACQIVTVSSSEPESGQGNGDRAPDWIITGSMSVDLRAERVGSGAGRVYTISVMCSDEAGNSSSGEVAVLVPHDQG